MLSCHWSRLTNAPSFIEGNVVFTRSDHDNEVHGLLSCCLSLARDSKLLIFELHPMDHRIASLSDIPTAMPQVGGGVRKWLRREPEELACGMWCGQWLEKRARLRDCDASRISRLLRGGNSWSVDGSFSSIKYRPHSSEDRAAIRDD